MTDALSDRFRALLKRLKAGDSTARDELIDLTADRLRSLASRMFHPNDRLRRWFDSGDVFVNSSFRLWRSLSELTPRSEREFFALATLHIRRELTNLARSVFGPEGIGANHDSVVGDSTCQKRQPVSRDPDPADLERWCRFHEAVERLPDLDREIVGLIYYHGWTQPQVADLLDVSTKTVARRWVAALSILRRSIDPPSTRRDD